MKFVPISKRENMTSFSHSYILLLFIPRGFQAIIIMAFSNSCRQNYSYQLKVGLKCSPNVFKFTKSCNTSWRTTFGLIAKGMQRVYYFIIKHTQKGNDNNNNENKVEGTSKQ